MEQSSSWKCIGFLANQETPHIVSNMTLHYCIHKILPLVPILSQVNLIHDVLPSHFLKIYFNNNPSNYA